MSFQRTLPFSCLKSFLLPLASSLFTFLLLSTISFSHNFVGRNRHPFGLLIKLRLWNLTIFEISIVSSDSAANYLCLFLFLQRSWPALATGSCSSQGRRGIRNLPFFVLTRFYVVFQNSDILVSVRTRLFV